MLFILSYNHAETEAGKLVPDLFSFFWNVLHEGKANEAKVNFILWLPLLFEILGNVCIVVIFSPACDVIGSVNIFFGKKGMSLNCEIFFKKNEDVLVKSVYVTTIYRCDQDMIARLNIADIVLKEYK